MHILSKFLPFVNGTEGVNTMFKSKKIASLLAFVLLLTMILSTVALVSCDNPVIIIKKTTTGDGEKLNDPIFDPIDDNYRTLYQIYVRSFADSNGDGVGDIRGIIETFDYLNDGDMANGNDLGVQAIWLTPIFHGNSAHKYDAIDFYSIDPEFGTEEDLAELIALCNERNVKLIFDLALNHTSTSNEWFKEFKKAHQNNNTSSKYYNFYSWSTTKVNDGYVKVNDQNLWYESWFDSQGSMPELNYDNQAVKNEMLNVAKYWMDMGVDGFRFDAIKHIYTINANQEKFDHSKNASFYNWYTSQLRKLYPDIYLVGECWTDEATMLEYYKSLDCFNFSTAQNGKIASAARGQGAVSTFVDAVSNLQQKITAKRSDAMISLFLSNHDQNRSAGYITNDNYRKMAASLYLLTPGTPVIYYGEEIGLLGAGDCRDGANYRLPMKWGDVWTCEVPGYQTYLKGDKLEYYFDYEDVNDTVYEQQRDEDSLMRHYAKVLNIRHTYPAIARGTYKPLYSGKSTFGGFLVDYNNDDVIILHNTSASETVTFDLKSLKSSNNSMILSGYSTFEILDYVGVNDASISGTTLTLGPQTTVIIK